MQHCCGGEKKENLTLNVKGMTCHHCEMSVKKAVGSIEGVDDVNVELDKGRVVVEHRGQVNVDRIINAINDLGYEVTG